MEYESFIMKRPRWSAAIAVVASLIATTTVPTLHVVAQSPYATQLISENAAFGGNSLYNDPNSVLGEPTRIAINNDPILGSSPFHVKIVEGVYNREFATNNKVVTTMSRKPDGAGGFIYGSSTVKFDHLVLDDPANPYGIDLNVFGNAFYTGTGISNDATDMRSRTIAGIFAEPLVVSVSPDNVNWYSYGTGPFGDTAFPTQGHEWSDAQHDASGNGWTTVATDFTKPVNPTLNSVLGAAGQPMSAADAMATYVGSGGGAGIDLAPSGFGWIQYVRVQSTAQFRDGEIDAFADARPMRVGNSLSITPANVADGTPLYFQSNDDESHTSVLAEFSSVSSMAKLTTAVVTDPTALAALDQELLASYQLDVLALVGNEAVGFVADYQLSPGQAYVGDGSDLQLLQWDGVAWNAAEFAFDGVTHRLAVNEWTDSSAMLAVIQSTAVEPAGDFSGDGRVDAADYVAWRKGAGVPATEPYYNAWRAAFGETMTSGASLVLDSSVAPEPAAIVSAMLACLAVVGLRRRRNG